MIWKRSKTSTVGLFEVYPDGAGFSWNDEGSRALALEMFVEIARQLEGERDITRLRLSGGMHEPIDPADPIDVADVSTFAGVAPQLVQSRYKSYRLVFRLNAGERAYTIHHLDQVPPHGFWFETPVAGEPFLAVLQRVLADFAQRPTGVRIDLGPWFSGG